MTFFSSFLLTATTVQSIFSGEGDHLDRLPCLDWLFEPSPYDRRGGYHSKRHHLRRQIFPTFRPFLGWPPAKLGRPLPRTCSPHLGSQPPPAVTMLSHRCHFSVMGTVASSCPITQDRVHLVQTLFTYQQPCGHVHGPCPWPVFVFGLANPSSMTARLSQLGTTWPSWFNNLFSVVLARFRLFFDCFWYFETSSISLHIYSHILAYFDVIHVLLIQYLFIHLLFISRYLSICCVWCMFV